MAVATNFMANCMQRCMNFILLAKKKKERRKMCAQKVLKIALQSAAYMLANVCGYIVCVCVCV